MAERTKNDKEKVHVDSTYVCPDCGREEAEADEIVHAPAYPLLKARE